MVMWHCIGLHRCYEMGPLAPTEACRSLKFSGVSEECRVVGLDEPPWMVDDFCVPRVQPGGLVIEPSEEDPHEICPHPTARARDEGRPVRAKGTSHHFVLLGMLANHFVYLCII